MEYEENPEYSQNQMTRHSLPTKDLSFCGQLVEETGNFLNKAFSPPRKVKKKSVKSKLNQGNMQMKSGRWSTEEHEKFLEAIDLYGPNWKKVQGHVLTRTSTQARSHAQKVLSNPNSGKGIIISHNSTSTTMTKNSPSSNKNELILDFKKDPSVSSDENNSEFAIFKVERIQKPLIGRSRLKSENNVFTIPVDNSTLPNVNGKKNCNRKFSMNIEFERTKIDLISSPIREPIKEHVLEYEEEEKEGNEHLMETPLVRHNTIDFKEVGKMTESKQF